MSWIPIMQTVLNNLYCGTIKILPKDVMLAKHRPIRLYKIYLPNFEPSLYRFEHLLSISEKERANRYHFEKDRNRFIICRVFLKNLLAEELGVDVLNIEIGYLPNKKPFLPSHPTLYFNLSHSNEMALVAISSRKVGVDLEKMENANNYFGIIPTIFSSNEIVLFNKSDDKNRKFFESWTRKEAIVKTIGSGITDDLKSIPVTDGCHNIKKDILGDIKNLVTLSFHIDNQYIGSLSYEGEYQNSFDRLSFTDLPILNF